VLLHGGLACVATWRDFPERLAAATSREVVAHSRRGHGASPPGPAAWPVSFMHDEAARLGELGLSRPVLVGHSDGASIALLHAASGAALGGLVLLAPHVFVEQLTVDSIRRAWTDPSFPARLRRHHGANTDTLFDAWCRVWTSDAFRSWNIEDAAARVTCPLLVVQGAADEYGTLAHVESIAARAPQAELLVLPGVGHVPQRDAADVVVEAIAGWLPPRGEDGSREGGSA
jgi:pimeloyl-ACP methyl ester carboxylesterase